MLIKVKFRSVLAISIGMAVGLVANTASAVTLEVAKKCEALMAQAFPPREPGNPAAGSTKGTGLEAQNYYQKCVADNSKAGDDANAPGK
jgi:hypothetical protein